VPIHLPAKAGSFLGTHSIREIFLKPAVTDDYNLAYESANEDGLLRFLCEEHDFSLNRVEKVIGRMRGVSRSINSQSGLENWFDT
jgi:flap endonuclease-1